MATGIVSAPSGLPTGGFHQPAYHTNLYGTVIHPLQNPNPNHVPVVFSQQFVQSAPVSRATKVSRVIAPLTRPVAGLTPF